jgi:PBP1b-binding outer membrane lipoprotein LpoB
MKMWKMFVLALLFTVMISGCSSTSEESKKANVADKEIESNTSKAEDSTQPAELVKEDVIESKEVADGAAKETTDKKMSSADDRMVIYTANLSIRVNSYQDTLKLVQQQLSSVNGYIVESNSYSTGEGDSLEGMITVRIPQDKFESFLQSVENGSTKVVDRSIAGQDVTEEFVDLESRLRSKQVVEKRLLNFMEKAEKTEDLLKISTDLATIQEEIEQIKGRMNYLNNKVELATVTIHVTEDKVNVPSLENKDLNTWEKTKEQFMNSVNFLLNVCSVLFIFIIGSLPILLIIGILLIIIIFFMRKRQKNVQEKPPTNPEE